ncbi:hypothetical protein GOODEAATRI_013274 [Goodea atripinnis]|uniref:Alpha-macroglobulin-like TED domain-containing protein n=1 Tax=Goodea atripinnis TaxID=208336 RepID=A0ABV0MHF2_9TELE
MKSFGGARDYVYVDPQHIKDARTWLSRLQKKDGCFTSVGKLFHNSMKGGVSDDVSLTAYIVAAMLELDGVASDPVVQSGLKCLTDAVTGGFDNLYTMALMSYTFSLAGDQEMRSKLITILDQKAKKDVVALQALAKYAAATYSPQGTTTVTVTSLGGLRKEFTVTQSNRLLYQEEKLREVSGEYTIRARGQSCVLAQVNKPIQLSKSHMWSQLPATPV